MKRVAKRRKRKVKLKRRKKRRGKLRMILLETKITTPLRTNKVWSLSQFSSFSFFVSQEDEEVAQRNERDQYALR